MIHLFNLYISFIFGEEYIEWNIVIINNCTKSIIKNNLFSNKCRKLLKNMHSFNSKRFTVKLKD